MCACLWVICLNSNAHHSPAFFEPIVMQDTWYSMRKKGGKISLKKIEKDTLQLLLQEVIDIFPSFCYTTCSMK